MVAVVVVEISGDGDGEMINRDLPGGDGGDKRISVIDGGMELGGCGRVNNEVVVCNGSVFFFLSNLRLDHILSYRT